MKTSDIQQALWIALHKSNQLVLPNYTPRNWWECDMMSVSKAGYWSEFEIKLSVADFKADAKKSTGGGWKIDRSSGKPERVSGRFKHQELALASVDGPSHFWFVLPEALCGKVEIPEWAGLQAASDDSGRTRVWVKKSAPRLHNAKLSPEVVKHALGACYWRYWNLRTDLQAAVNRELHRLAESAKREAQA
jgi:hypothetical protein